MYENGEIGSSPAVGVLVELYQHGPKIMKPKTSIFLLSTQEVREVLARTHLHGWPGSLGFVQVSESAGQLLARARASRAKAMSRETVQMLK